MENKPCFSAFIPLWYALNLENDFMATNYIGSAAIFFLECSPTLQGLYCHPSKGVTLIDGRGNDSCRLFHAAFFPKTAITLEMMLLPCCYAAKFAKPFLKEEAQAVYSFIIFPLLINYSAYFNDSEAVSNFQLGKAKTHSTSKNDPKWLGAYILWIIPLSRNCHLPC
ncbi:hypothetical protein EGR_05418 [Echinococcus granulosus]|uniref:Uncharacterized protein n=1 Tax=Echinococcus granulosus TaxID=6210 RepID=W6UFJ6_ECHGR|nr:hypothetical protein EGR_05418 [Echinococcus granulosus]EUB59656.1 hypothetical protein EGR_05418 [Echinococcus granulosus]